MSDLMTSPVLLAILQNQIKNAVDENKVDTSKFPIYKTIGRASELTAEEKNDISKNAYQFLIESNGDLYVLSYHYDENDWCYYNLSYSYISNLDNDGLTSIKFARSYYVNSDINGNVIFTGVINGDSIVQPYFVTLVTEKYPGVYFSGNYVSQTTGSIIYRFSSGIILDSSSETPQYKIVLATYDVNAAKVTFVEKVLP